MGGVGAKEGVATPQGMQQIKCGMQFAMLCA